MLKNLNMKTKLYIIAVYLAAILIVLYEFGNPDGLHAKPFEIVFFAFLSILAESLQVNFSDISISTGFTVTLASVLLFGTKAAMIIISAGTLFRVIKKDNNIYHIFNTPPYKSLFNVADLIISVAISTKLYEYAGGRYYTDNMSILPIILLTIVFLVVNYSIIYYLVYTITNKNFLQLLYENISMGLLNIIAMAPLGIGIAMIFRRAGYLGVIVLFAPILLARYTFLMYINMKKSYMDTVRALSLAVEAKDRYTEGHSSRVVGYAEKIGREMRLSESHIENLKISSLLHDIGKIGIPEAILNKPGKLTNEEYTRIKEHPIIGADIVKDVDALKNSVDIIRHHHERYDGGGYPDGIGGDDVPLDAYIISLADAFDAMCSDRPYRKAMPMEKAVEIIKQERGKQFSPKVVDTFLKVLDTVKEKPCL